MSQNLPFARRAARPCKLVALVLDADQENFPARPRTRRPGFGFNSAETKYSVSLYGSVVRWLTVAGRSLSPFSGCLKIYPFRC